MPNHSVVSVYCHWDGYPEGVGATLKKHYQDPAKIQSLMDLGSLSVLGSEIGERQDFDNRETRNEEWCLAYGRDRGEKDTSAKEWESIDALVKNVKSSDQEFLYLYDNGWKYLDIDQVEKSGWQTL